MKVTVRLFAIARDAMGDGTVELELDGPATVAMVRDALVTRLPELATLAEHLRFAVNAEFASNETIVTSQDEVACIPPVSGG